MFLNEVASIYCMFIFIMIVQDYYYYYYYYLFV